MITEITKPPETQRDVTKIEAKWPQSITKWPWLQRHAKWDTQWPRRDIKLPQTQLQRDTNWSQVSFVVVPCLCPLVSFVCFSVKTLYLWVTTCVLCAHATVPRPNSFRCEGFWEIRAGWLSVRMQWGPSEHFHSQMSLLVCLDSETWFRQMHKPLWRRFFSSARPSGACRDKVCEESHRKQWSFILSPADNRTQRKNHQHWGL